MDLQRGVAVEGDAEHLTIHTCRWLASNGYQVFPPIVRFIGASYETIGIWATISERSTFAFPHGKRSRIATIHVEPSTHIAGLIRVQVVTRPLTVPF